MRRSSGAEQNPDQTVDGGRGVVFAGDADGNFIALDAATGRDLWHVQTGAAIYSAAISYQLADRQYIAIPTGTALFAFVLPKP